MSVLRTSVRNIFTTAVFAAVLGATFLFAAADAKAGSSVDEIRQAGKVRIGVNGDLPPFGYVDQDGKSQGYDVYFGRRIAKELLGDESKAEFVIVETPNRVEYLQSNKIDILLANFTMTPARAEQVDFVKPYMKVGLGVVSPEIAKITSVDQLKGKTLIVTKGATADAYFSEHHPEINLLKFDQNSESFNALRDGRGDALAHDNAILFAWARVNKGFVTGVESLGEQEAIAPAVKKGNASLQKWLNELIVELGKERFFHKNYDVTLKPFYGEGVNPDSVVVEGGEM